MIIQRVYLNGFIDAFTAHGRANQFTYDAFAVLHDWLEQIAEDTEKPYELDVVGLSCEWNEHSHKEAMELCGVDDIDEIHDHHFCLNVGDDRILISE